MLGHFTVEESAPVPISWKLVEAVEEEHISRSCRKVYPTYSAVQPACLLSELSPLLTLSHGVKQSNKKNNVLQSRLSRIRVSWESSFVKDARLRFKRPDNRGNIADRRQTFLSTSISALGAHISLL
jgi:hypothetical protein